MRLPIRAEMAIDGRRTAVVIFAAMLAQLDPEQYGQYEQLADDVAEAPELNEDKLVGAISRLQGELSIEQLERIPAATGCSATRFDDWLRELVSEQRLPGAL